MIEVVWGGSKNTDDRDAMAKWCASQLWPETPERHFGPCVTMGVLNKGKPIAVMVFHSHDPYANTIEFSGAATSRRWITRKSLTAMFDYPFKDVGVQMLWTRNSTKPHQAHLHRMLESYGMEKQRIRRFFGRDDDAYVWTMTDDEWRQSKFNKGRK